MIPRQGEQCPVVIISYMGYSPPKCTCHGNQTHSRKYMILLECLHAQFPCLESSPIPSHMPKPNSSKIQFQNKRFLFSKTYYRVSVNIYWTTLRGELLGNSPKQSWVSLRDELLDNSPRQFFGKSSLKFLSQPFSFLFHFLSCHALTPTI